MATYLATWGGPGPAPFHAPVVVQPPVVPTIPVTAIADTAFRRKKRKRKYQLEQIGKPAVRVSVIAVPDAAIDQTKRDFRTLVELSGKSMEAFRAEVDREIAALMRKQQEDDDEEALTMILTVLED
jgi:hypothetical protein